MLSKEYFLKRKLYFIGFIFIYLIPIIMIFENVFEIKEVINDKKIIVSFTWVILGFAYLTFVSKFIGKKINDLKPSPFKSFLIGVVSLIPITVIASLLQVMQELVNKMPHLDVAKNIWLIIISIVVGLVLQIIDSAINRKYLYDIEIEKEAKRSIDVEKRKKELIEEREKLND